MGLEGYHRSILKPTEELGWQYIILQLKFSQPLKLIFITKVLQFFGFFFCGGGQSLLPSVPLITLFLRSLVYLRDTVVGVGLYVS
jgi:hypothetical protein